MKTSSSITALAVALQIAFNVSASGQKDKDPNFTPPGTEEQAAVDKANATLDTVYAQLRKKLGPEQSKSLQEAQRAWIKWRDAEADLIARLGNDIGHGSAFRVDFANAQTKLINQRTEVLRKYLSEAASP
jgi:uncharacterized protein YecT (DUF1311 family)